MTGVLPVAALRRFRGSHAAAARCALCTEAVGAEHRHLYDREQRSLACACIACHLLFDRPGANGRWQSIPDRVITDANLSPQVWEELGVPVGLVFLVREAGTLIPRFPGPAGVIDGELDAEAIAAATAATPLLSMLQDDIETVIVQRTHDRTRAVLAPVAEGYRLAGELRTTWEGFDGGDAARNVVTRLLDELEARAQVIGSPAA